MARSVIDIQNQIIAQVQNSTELGTMSSSTTAIWRLWAYIVASAIYLLEQIFDTHKSDVSNQLALMKPHTRLWYQTKSFAFQYGATLADGEDTYDNTGLNTAQIEGQKIIKRCAVVENADRLDIKVAKESGGEPIPLSSTELNAFTNYIGEIKDAGVRIDVISVSGDVLRLWLDVFYDMQVLDSNGARLDGTAATPVQIAIKNFLKKLPFNGVLLLSDLIDAVQQVEGVVSPIVRKCEVDTPNGTTFTVSDYWYAGAGYFRLFDNDINLNFIQYNF